MVEVSQRDQLNRRRPKEAINGTHSAHHKTGQKLMGKVAEPRWRRFTIPRRPMSPKPKQKPSFNFDIQSSCSIRAVWLKTFFSHTFGAALDRGR